MSRDATDHMFLSLELEVKHLKNQLDIFIKHNINFNQPARYLVGLIEEKLNKVKDELRGEVKHGN